MPPLGLRRAPAAAPPTSSPVPRSFLRTHALTARAAGVLLGLTWAADMSGQRTDDDTITVHAVDQVSVTPILLRQPPLNYPDSLRRASVAGTVALRGILDPRGHLEPASVQVVTSPNSALTALARAHLLESTFSPALVKRRRVRVALDLEVEFNPLGRAPDPLPVYTKDDGLTESPRYLPTRDAPTYPAILQKLGIDGVVIAQLIVDTLGRPERESIQIVETADPKFVAPVSRFVADARFRPGRIGDRAVRVLVWLPFDFRLRPGWAECQPSPYDPFGQRCPP